MLAAVAAWFREVARGTLPRVWMFRDMQVSGPLTTLVAREADARGFSARIVNEYHRPHLTRLDGGLEQHFQRCRGKTAARDCTLRPAPHGAGALTFERSGHTGRGPSQVGAVSPKSRRADGRVGRARPSCVARIVPLSGPRGLHSPGNAHSFTSVDALLLDGRPIARSLMSRTGTTAFHPEMHLRRDISRVVSPGLVLEARDHRSASMKMTAAL
jgi:hypothetical protein